VPALGQTHSRVVGLGYFFPNNPNNDGNRPLAVLRTTRAVGEYKPTRCLARCLTRLGFIQAWTWLIPSSRFTRRLTPV
jgi:hypothetical protein